MNPSSLQQNIIYLCAEFSHMFKLALTEAFRNHHLKITTEQFSVLAVLWYQDGLSQKEISRQLNRDKTTMTRVIGKMEEKKLVRQKTDTADKRSKLVFLTPQGKALQQLSVNVSGTLYHQVLRHVPDAALTASISALHQMMENVPSIKKA
jgi:DNA-binding MarR family transcriptional regulator